MLATVAGIFGTIFGGTTTYLNAKRKAKSDDLSTLQKTVETLRNQSELASVQQTQLMNYIMQLQLDKEKLAIQVDQLQDEVHQLQAAHDRKDSRIQMLEAQMASCPVISGNGVCERSKTQ